MSTENTCDLCELLFFELDKVVGYCGEIFVEAGTELGKLTVITSQLCVFDLHQIVLHARDLLRAKLSKEVSNLREHVLLIFLSVSLDEHVFLIASLGKVTFNLVNVFLVKLCKELYDRSHILVFKSRHLSKKVFVIFCGLYLHEVLLNLIDSPIIKVLKIASDLSKEVLVLHVWLIKS